MEPPKFNLPSDTVLQGLMDDLNNALHKVPETQQRLMSLTGVAWSADGMVKAEVGPRGQLIDIEIDPRILRRSDAQALKSAIMEAVTAAVRRVVDQSQEIVYGQVPPEIAELRAQFQPGTEDPIAQMLLTDAEILDRRSPDA